MMFGQSDSSPFFLPSLSDAEFAEIVKCAQAGDKDAFVILIRHFEGILMGHLKRLTGDNDIAEDIWGETVYRAWKSLPQTDQGLRYVSKAKKWLFKIAENLAKDYFKSLQALQTISIEHIEQCHKTGNVRAEKDWKQLENISTKSAEDIACEKEHIISQQADINVALSHVSPQYLRCFHMKYAQGLSHQAIAQNLHISESCSRSYACRGRKEFFKALTQQRAISDQQRGKLR